MSPIYWVPKFNEFGLDTRIDPTEPTPFTHEFRWAFNTYVTCRCVLTYIAEHQPCGDYELSRYFNYEYEDIHKALLLLFNHHYIKAVKLVDEDGDLDMKYEINLKSEFPPPNP
jgi:hypothetical protein